MQVFKSNRLSKKAKIHLSDDAQINAIGFETPLQQILQEQAPLLRLLDQQQRWQLWLSSRPMLKRSWIKQAGLNESKVIHCANIAENEMIQVIEKALLSRKNSYIVACVAQIDDHHKRQLQLAVKASGTHLFLIDDEFMNHNDFMMMSQLINCKTH
ncbi:SulA-like leucine-rich domain-containing protein [Utexia brackfieldae]|uniref:SulA-like leucine-rich domain-containing protein n=1 Tax=Utexia brackfieldae TaxID=3074108 RepID=UPI00370D42AC